MLTETVTAEGEDKTNIYLFTLYTLQRVRSYENNKQVNDTHCVLEVHSTHLHDHKNFVLVATNVFEKLMGIYCSNIKRKFQSNCCTHHISVFIGGMDSIHVELRNSFFFNWSICDCLP